MNLPPKNPLRETRYAAFFVKPLGNEREEEEDDDELVLDEEDLGNSDE